MLHHTLLYFNHTTKNIVPLDMLMLIVMTLKGIEGQSVYNNLFIFLFDLYLHLYKSQMINCTSSTLYES